VVDTKKDKVVFFLIKNPTERLKNQVLGRVLL